MPNNNQANSHPLSDNWTDNILVKEQSGQLHRYKSGPTKSTALTQHTDLSLKIMAPALAPDNEHFLDLPKLGNSQDKAKFGFHPDDEEEVASLVKDIPQDNSRKYSIEKIVDKLIDQEKLKFSADTKNKFTDILFDFFRNRRNAIIIRELLSERIESNGKILTEEQVNNIVGIVKSIKAKIEVGGGLVVKMAELAVKQANHPVVSKAKALPNEVAELEADLNKELPPSKPQEKTQAEVEKLLSALSTDELAKAAGNELADADENDADLKPILKTVQKLETLKPKPKAEVKVSPAPVKKPEDEIKAALPKVFRVGAGDKKPVSDVKVTKEKEVFSQPIYSSSVAAPKATLTGPIEELQSLDLDKFRRLGSSSRQQIDKLLQKINVLEKDSITKKAQGIEGWRRSPVYQLYLSLGEESLSQGKDVENIIREKLNNKENTLTIEEFASISDLNKLLRF